MTQHLGDFADDATVDFKWSTNGADGASITRATNGTVSVYIGNSTTQLTTGVTDTEDFDGLTGVHHCRIDLSSSASYVPGSECQVVLSAATIDGATVNTVLASFSIERAGGVLALLKGTNSLSQIRTDIAAVQTDTNDIQARLPAALVSGRMDASVGAMANNVMTAAAAAADLTTELQSGLATAANLATVAGYLDTEIAAILADTNELQTDWANGGRLDLILDARAAQTTVDAIQVTTDKLDDTLEATSDGYVFSDAALANAPTGGGGGGPTAEEIADELQTRTIAGVTVVHGLANGAITAASTASDYVTEMQAAAAAALTAYDPPTNAELEARTLVAANYATASALTTVDTVVDAIQAKTDALPSDPADQSLIINATDAVMARLGAPAGASISADIAAAKADTAAILLDTGTDGVVVATASKSGYRLSATGVDDILDEAVEGSVTLRQSQRLHNAVLGGKVAGMGTTAVEFRDLADTKNVLEATVDGDGNRETVTRDLT